MISSLFLAITITGCSYALLIGRWDARVASSLYLLTVAATAIFGMEYRSQLDPAVLIFDTLCCLGLVMLALISDRNWTVWAAGLQFSEVAAHFPVFFITIQQPHIYQYAQGFWAIPTISIIVLGASFEGRYENEKFVNQQISD